MSPTIQLTVLTGELQGQTLVFGDRTLCTVGRANDCSLRLDDAGQHVISRHHCVLDVNPPHVRVRDLGSRNGTFLNGENVGQRQRHLSPEEAALVELPSYELRDGDEVGVGDIRLLVHIDAPAGCRICGQAVARGAGAGGDPGQVPQLCKACQVQFESGRWRPRPGVVTRKEEEFLCEIW
jgi:serine/threonine-protein kinase